VSEIANRFSKEIFIMGKKTRSAILLATAGSMLAFGGCLNLNYRQLLWGTALYAAQEYVLDNDAVFDLFPDGTAG
jgi:hypothetical protein